MCSSSLYLCSFLFCLFNNNHIDFIITKFQTSIYLEHFIRPKSLIIIGLWTIHKLNSSLPNQTTYYISIHSTLFHYYREQPNFQKTFFKVKFKQKNLSITYIIGHYTQLSRNYSMILHRTFLLNTPKATESDFNRDHASASYKIIKSRTDLYCYSTAFWDESNTFW